MNMPCIVFYDKVNGKILHSNVNMLMGENGNFTPGKIPEKDWDELIARIVADMRLAERLVDSDISNLGILNLSLTDDELSKLGAFYHIEDGKLIKNSQ